MRLNIGVSATETADGAVLLDERTGEFWQLNETAAIVVGILAAEGTVQDAAQQIADEFGIDPAQSLRDVQELVESLRAARLVSP